MMTLLHTLSQIYSLLVQEERQRQVKTGNDFQINGASFSASIAPNTSINFMKSSLGNNVPFRKSKGRRSQLFCDHCKRTGHTMDSITSCMDIPTGKKEEASH